MSKEKKSKKPDPDNELTDEEAIDKIFPPEVKKKAQEEADHRH